jgi:hypothetical protein
LSAMGYVSRGQDHASPKPPKSLVRRKAATLSIKALRKSFTAYDSSHSIFGGCGVTSG